MVLAPWRSPLARNIHLHRRQPEARYVQLATVSPDCLPANRTVVFRGFLSDTNSLKFVTDTRSAKVQHLHHHPHGEVCWYFPKTHEQFRFTGILAIAPDLQLRAWQELSAKAQAQFSLEFFGLLLLEPNRVDWLQLRNETRTLYLLEQMEWQITAIAP